MEYCFENVACGQWKIENCLFCQGVLSILKFRSKNVACVPLCYCFSSYSPEYVHLKDFEDSPWSLLCKGHLSIN